MGRGFKLGMPPKALADLALAPWAEAVPPLSCWQLDRDLSNEEGSRQEVSGGPGLIRRVFLQSQVPAGLGSGVGPVPPREWESQLGCGCCSPANSPVAVVTILK